MRIILKSPWAHGHGAQDVGYMVGFKNRSHFSQAFKKRFGYAPSNYLKLSTAC